MLWKKDGGDWRGACATVIGYELKIERGFIALTANADDTVLYWEKATKMICKSEAARPCFHQKFLHGRRSFISRKRNRT